MAQERVTASLDDDRIDTEDIRYERETFSCAFWRASTGKVACASDANSIIYPTAGA
jgi:hypothetical protein